MSQSGSDTNDGRTSETPKKTIRAGLAALARENNTAHQLLLRRGDRWDIADEGGAGKGVWRWDTHGLSEVDRCGIGAYGPETDPRPILENGGIWYGAKVRPLRFFSLRGIEFYWSANDPNSPKFQQAASDHRGFFVGLELDAARQSRDISVTDCVFRFCTVGAAILGQTAGIKLNFVGVIGNQFINCKNFGLMADRLTESQVADNQFIECGWTDRTVQLHAAYLTDCDHTDISENIFIRPGNFGLKFSANAKGAATDFSIVDNVFFGGGLGMGHARLDGSWNPLTDYSHQRGLVSGNFFSQTCKDFPAGSGQFQSMGCNIGNVESVEFSDNIFAHNQPEAGGEIFRFADPSAEQSKGVKLLRNHVWNWMSRARRQGGSYSVNVPVDTVQIDNLAENNRYFDATRSLETVGEEQALAAPVQDFLEYIREGFAVIGKTDDVPVPDPPTDNVIAVKESELKAIIAALNKILGVKS